MKVFHSAITKNGPKKNRVLGIDLTFSAPKSVSLAYLLLGDERILNAHLKAIQWTLDYVEEKLLMTRYKEKRQAIQEASFACFTHFASKDLDPQLHTHCLCINAVKRQDGSLASFEASLLFKHQKELGGLYRTILADELRELSYEVIVQALPMRR